MTPLNVDQYVGYKTGSSSPDHNIHNMSYTVSIQNTSKITPLPPLPCQPCSLLCPSDLQMLGVDYIQKGLVYKPSSDGTFQQMVESLKLSLAKTLVHFYPLAGRIAISQSDQTVGIDCSNQGAEFIEAYAQNVYVDEIIQGEVGPLVRKLFAMDGALNIHGLHLPLLVIQVTRLEDGLVVSFTGNHCIMDGTSLWHFLNSWAEICRGNEEPSNFPNHSRCFDIENAQPIPFNSLCIPITQYNPSSFCAPSLVERIFHFSKETISQLKKQANKEKDAVISSFQALCAHIWQAITRARRLAEDEETAFMLSVDCRKRVSPPLPDTYFGNAIAIKLVSAKLLAKQVLSAKISYLAGLINTKIKEMQDHEIKEVIEEYHKHPFVHRSRGDYSEKNKRCASMLIGSSPRFPMYEVDFGWGRPVAVRSGWANKSDGKLAAFPSPLGDGDMDIEVCLEPENMEALLADPLFLTPSFTL